MDYKSEKTDYEFIEADYIFGNDPVNTTRTFRFLRIIIRRCKKGMVRKRRSQKEIPTPKTEVGKTKLTIGYLYFENIVSRVCSYPQ